MKCSNMLLENNKGKSSKYLIDINNEYIEENIEILEEWSERQVDNILYDSDRDGKDSQTFRNKIMNHQHLYFIIIDSDNNVFGHYNEVTISKTNYEYTRDEQSFMYTLNNNNRCGIKKFQLKSTEYDHSVYIKGEAGNSNYYFCGNGGSYGWCEVISIGNNSSQLCDMSKSYEGINKTDLIGRDPGTQRIKFTTKRLIVLEMK